MISKDLFYRFWFLSLLILLPVLGQNNSRETVLFSNSTGTESYFYGDSGRFFCRYVGKML